MIASMLSGCIDMNANRKLRFAPLHPYMGFFVEALERDRSRFCINFEFLGQVFAV